MLFSISLWYNTDTDLCREHSSSVRRFTLYITARHSGVARCLKESCCSGWFVLTWRMVLNFNSGMCNKVINLHIIAKFSVTW